MRYRRLDNEGDYTFGAGSADMLLDIEACAQAIKTRLWLLFGEWWEDLTDGLPLFQKVLAQHDINIASEAIRDRIIKTPHVTSIIYFSADWDNEQRQLAISCVVETDYGQLTVEGVKF